MSEPAPHLSEICEETFLFLASFRRMAGRTEMGAQEIRLQVRNILQRQAMKAREHPRIYELYEKAQYLLVVTLDDVILKSNWEHARDWQLLEQELFGSSVGGREFFTLQADPSSGEQELQEIFYLCLALGFEGQHARDKAVLAEMRNRAYLRLNNDVRRGQDLLTPEAYQQLDGQEHVTVPHVKLAKAAIALVGVIAGLFIVGSALYAVRVQQLMGAAQALAQQDGQDNPGGR